MQEKMICGDGPCKYGKPICCLECYAFGNCPDGCVQQTCEVCGNGGFIGNRAFKCKYCSRYNEERKAKNNEKEIQSY